MWVMNMTQEVDWFSRVLVGNMQIKPKTKRQKELNDLMNIPTEASNKLLYQDMVTSFHSGPLHKTFPSAFCKQRGKFWGGIFADILKT